MREHISFQELSAAKVLTNVVYKIFPPSFYKIILMYCNNKE